MLSLGFSHLPRRLALLCSTLNTAASASVSALNRMFNLYRNSEIYNHDDVQQQYLPGVSMVRDSKSDSAKPGHLYQKYGDNDKIWNALDGTFACVIYDERTQQFCAARDPIGICPMYWGKDKDGATWFASEMKALQHQCVSFEIFPPVSHTPRLAVTTLSKDSTVVLQHC